MFIQRLLLVKYVHGIKKNQLNGQVYNDSDRGNNKGERSYKISLCKVCFLAKKDKQRDREPTVSLVLLGLFTDRNDAFLPFHILQLVKSVLF